MNGKILQLESVAMRNGVSELGWGDNSRSHFHPIWLRDNCRCAECGDPAIGYRSLQLTLKPGDIAIFDNHRVLHGRTDLSVDGQRWLQWVQIERGDFHSSLRILADRLGQARDARPLMKGAYGRPACGGRYD
jgi:hypothetical protein